MSKIMGLADEPTFFRFLALAAQPCFCKNELHDEKMITWRAKWFCNNVFW